MVGAYIQLLKDWKNVGGRMRRDKFWEAFACNVFILILLAMFSYRLEFFQWVYAVYYVISFIPFITAAIRRLHDSDKSAWWLLLGVVFFVGWVILAVMLCWASNPEENKYGANPYEPGYYHL